VPHRKTVAIVATTAASLVGRCSALASQAIVGIYLTEAEVGLYAAALGIIGITGIWRNGGTATYLPSVKVQDFDRLANPMFLWALCAGLATALLTCAVAAMADSLPEALTTYKVPGLPAVLLVLALRCLAAPFALIGRMRLAVEHRFAPLAKVDTVNHFLRLGLTWGIAANGGGTLALAVPYTASSLVDVVAAWLLDGFRRSDFRPALGGLRVAAPLLAWPLVLAVLMSIRADISFLLIGFTLPAASLGVFFFAFQLANQPTMFLAGSLQNVLAPMIARARGTFEAERHGMERVFAMSMLFVPITTMAAASFFPSAERLIWDGKWSSAADAVTLLCIGATYATVAGLLFGPLIGLQRFRENAGFELLKMIGVIGGAALGAWLVAAVPASAETSGGAVTVIAGTVALGMAAGALWQLWWIARKYRFGLGDTLRNLTFGPLLAGLTAVAASSIGHSVVTTAGLGTGRMGALVELATIAATYLALITLAIRFTAETILRDTVEALPARVRGVAMRIFVLE
jgi:O-antigen/teichoic acid export membrane protein